MIFLSWYIFGLDRIYSEKKGKWITKNNSSFFCFNYLIDYGAYVWSKQFPRFFVTICFIEENRSLYPVGNVLQELIISDLEERQETRYNGVPSFFWTMVRLIPGEWHPRGYLPLSFPPFATIFSLTPSTPNTRSPFSLPIIYRMYPTRILDQRTRSYWRCMQIQTLTSKPLLFTLKSIAFILPLVKPQRL